MQKTLAERTAQVSAAPSTAPSTADSVYDPVTSDEETQEQRLSDSSDEDEQSCAKKRKCDEPVSQSDRKLQKLQKLGSKFVKKEEYGPAVHEVVASTVNSGLEAAVEHKGQTVQDLTKKYTRPENCKFLDVPKVNKALWTSKQTGQNLKDNDKLFQRSQLYLTKGMIPLVQIMDKTLTTESAEAEELFDLALDSFNLLAYAHRDFSSQRRRMLLPAISGKYKQLCQESAPISASHLFGDEADLEKRIKAIDDGRKLGNSISQTQAAKFSRTGSGQGNQRRGVEKDQRGFKQQHGSSYNKPSTSTSYGSYNNSFNPRQNFLGKKAQGPHNQQQKKTSWKKGSQGHQK